MNATRQAILELNNSLMMLNQSMTGQVPVLRDLKDSFLSIRPMLASLGGVIGRVSDLVNPIERLIEGFDKASDVQKKLLALNSNTASFLEANTKELEGMRGSFTDNVAELAESFSEGIRFSSKSYNVLRDRMQETGQSTSKLRETTKQLITATGGNVNAITRLTDSNMKIAKESMISNERLIDALARNEEAIDMASVVGMGEEQVDQLQKITAALSQRGVSDRQQQKVIDLLFSTDSNIVALRSQIGLDTNVGEKIMLGQTDFTTELNKASENINKLFVVTQGADKLNRTSFLLEGVQRSDLLKAAMLTNTLLQQDAKNGVEPTKEDKYYDQMMTFVAESKASFEKYTLENYQVVEEIPGILESIKKAMLVYFAFQAANQAKDFTKSFSARKSVEARTRASLPGAPEIEIQAQTNRSLDRMQRRGDLGTGAGAQAGRTLANLDQSLKAGAQSIFKSLANAFKGGGIIKAITTGIGGVFKGIFTVVGGLFKGLLGPLGLLLTALEFLPTIIDWISGWFGGDKKEDDENETKAANDELNKSIEDLQKSFQGASKNLDIGAKDMRSSFEIVTDSNGKVLTEKEKERNKEINLNKSIEEERRRQANQVPPPPPLQQPQQYPTVTPPTPQSPTQVIPPAPQVPTQTPAPTQITPPVPQVPGQSLPNVQNQKDLIDKSSSEQNKQISDALNSFENSFSDSFKNTLLGSKLIAENKNEAGILKQQNIWWEKFRQAQEKNDSGGMLGAKEWLFDLSEIQYIASENMADSITRALLEDGGNRVQISGQNTKETNDDVYQVSKMVEMITDGIKENIEVASRFKEISRDGKKYVNTLQLAAPSYRQFLGKGVSSVTSTSQTPAPTQVTPPAPQAPTQTPAPTQVTPPAPQAPTQTPAPTQVTPPAPQAPIQVQMPTKIIKASESNEGLDRDDLEIERQKNNLYSKFEENTKDLKNKDQFFSKFLENKELLVSAKDDFVREANRSGPSRDQDLVYKLRDQVLSIQDAFPFEIVKDLQKFGGKEVQTAGKDTPDISDDVYQISKSVEFLSSRGDKQLAQVIAEFTKTSNNQIDSVGRVLEQIGGDFTQLVLPDNQDPFKTPTATQVTPQSIGATPPIVPQQPQSVATTPPIVPQQPQPVATTPPIVPQQLQPPVLMGTTPPITTQQPQPVATTPTIPSPIIQTENEILKDIRTQSYRAIVQMTDQIAFSAKNLNTDQVEQLGLSKYNEDLNKQIKLLQENKDNQEKIKDILADTMKMSEEYNAKIASDSSINANTQREILNKGIKIRKEESTQSSGQTLESDAIRYLMAATSGGLSKKESQDMVKLTESINNLASKVGIEKDSARRGYVGRNSAR
jgi:hypothetical protein